MGDLRNRVFWIGIGLTLLVGCYWRYSMNVPETGQALRASEPLVIDALSQSCYLFNNASSTTWSGIYSPQIGKLSSNQFRIVNLAPSACTLVWNSNFQQYQDMSVIHLRYLNGTTPLTLDPSLTTENAACSSNVCVIPRMGQVGFQVASLDPGQQWYFTQYTQGPILTVTT